MPPLSNWGVANNSIGNITWTATATGWYSQTDPYIYIEPLPRGEGPVGTVVETIDQLAAAPAGTLVSVTRGDNTDHWLCDGKGSVTNKDSGATLPAAEFRSAILNQTVYLIESIKVGDTYVAGNRYVQILAAQGEDWLIGKSGTRGGAATLETFVGQPDATWGRKGGAVDAAVQAGFDLLLRLHNAEQSEVRLQEILDHGEVPTNESYMVTVLVHGTTSLLLSAKQVAEIYPEFGDVTLTEIDGFDVRFHREVTVRKRSRWGCACDQVDNDDVTRALGDNPGGRWEVVDCKPMAKGSKSIAHKAA